MTWRAFLSEEIDATGSLVHILDCLHRKPALNALRTGAPVVRQFCTQCSPSRRPVPPYVAIRREHIEYALGVIRGALDCDDLTNPHLGRAAILAFETALRRTEQNQKSMTERGSVEEVTDGQA